MKIKNHTIHEVFPMPSFFRGVLEKNTFCVLDIETTGLSSKYHQIVLIGLLYPQGQQTIVKQFFAENPKEEKELLIEFAEELKKYTFIITYNGLTFDYPFLKERFKKYNIPWIHEAINHFDILYYLKKFKKQLPLDNLKLKTVERFLGIHRKDTISGEDSVKLYKNYVVSSSPALEKTILLHNYEDIYYLAKVATIFDDFPEVTTLLDKTFVSFELSNQTVNITYHPSDISIKKNCLRIKGKTTKLANLSSEMYYTPSYQFNWIPSEGSFELEVPLLKTTLANKKIFNYINLSDFQPTFDLTMVDIICKDLFYQHFMEINLTTFSGLLASIHLINHIIYYQLSIKEGQPSTFA